MSLVVRFACCRHQRLDKGLHGPIQPYNFLREHLVLSRPVTFVVGVESGDGQRQGTATAVLVDFPSQRLPKCLIDLLVVRQ